MTLYKYLGVDGKGHFVRGVAEAENKSSLLKSLETRKVLAVIWEDANAELQPAPRGIPNASLANMGTTRIAPQIASIQIPFLRRWMLYVLPVIGFCCGYHYATTRTTPGVPMHEIRQKVAKIAVGQTRSQVEEVFNKTADVYNPAKTLYAGPPLITVEVDYALTGPAANQDDAVLRPPIIRSPYMRKPDDRVSPPTKNTPPLPL